MRGWHLDCRSCTSFQSSLYAKVIITSGYQTFKVIVTGQGIDHSVVLLDPCDANCHIQKSKMKSAIIARVDLIDDGLWGYASNIAEVTFRAGLFWEGSFGAMYSAATGKSRISGLQAAGDLTDFFLLPSEPIRICRTRFTPQALHRVFGPAGKHYRMRSWECLFSPQWCLAMLDRRTLGSTSTVVSAFDGFSNHKRWASRQTCWTFPPLGSSGGSALSTRLLTCCKTTHGLLA